jgi:expansin (peptidoglycan-binding protein)
MITVRIVDLCPECEMGHLDLSQEAFAKIADPSAGNVPITWSVVPCDVSGNLSYEYKDGTSQWWTAIQVRNSRRVVQGMEWMASGAWTPINRTDYNYFVVDSGVGPNPIQVRITAVTGEQLMDMLPAPASAVAVPGNVQFQ